MSDPIRMLHFADTHIGVENYGAIDPQTGISSRVLDFLRRITDVVEYAEANDADLAIFAGDAFKSRYPSPTHQREFARRIKRLAEVCPVLLLVGNHDLPAMTQKASSVEIFHTLDVPNVIVGRRDEVHRIETKRGPVQVATVPYPMRQRLLTREEAAGATIAQIDGMLEEVVGQIIANLAQQIDTSLPAVLTGHFSVSGAQYGSERSVMLGRDVVVLKSALMDPAWDYVALGHIHDHQDLTADDPGAPPVVYCGSLERVDFGEENEAKGFCWVELERGNVHWEFVPVAARPFVTVRVDARNADDPTQVVLDEIAKYDVADAVVRVLIATTPENDPLLRDRDVEAALGEAAHVAAIQHEIEHLARTRLDGASPESLTPLELLERYLVGKETPPERAEVLMEHAEAIFRAEDEALDDFGAPEP